MPEIFQCLVKSPKTLQLISKPGTLNPMFGKKHTPDTINDTINKIRVAASKFNVELLNLDMELIQCFSSNVELAKHLNINKTTVRNFFLKISVILNLKILTINITLEKVVCQ